MKTPNYVTIEDYKYTVGGGWEQKTLPAGTFVKPLELVYLPEHVKDSTVYRWFDKDKEKFVYCSHGIIVIDKDIIREV